MDAAASSNYDAGEQQSVLLQFVYQCPVGLAEVDNQGAIRLLNPVGVALLMPFARNCVLDNFFNVMRPHAPDLVDLIETSSVIGDICRGRRTKPGGPIQLSFTIVRLAINTIMIAFQNITAVVEAERRSREALEIQALQAGRLEMAATVLHDIGNAMTSVGTRSAQLFAEPEWPEIENLGRLALLFQSKAGQLAPVLGERKAAALGGLVSALERSLRQREIALREYARALVSSVSHIQDILSVQRQYVHNGGAGPRNRVALSDVVHDAIALQSAGLEKRGVAVERRLPPGLPPLSLDRTRMVQVVSNLIRNACESFDRMPDGGLPRLLEISAENAKPGWVRLTVKDNGSGFVPGNGPAFFEPGVTSKSNSNGLGLPGCRGAVESHGGRISIESEGAGKGATVIIELTTGESENEIVPGN